MWKFTTLTFPVDWSWSRLHWTLFMIISPPSDMKGYAYHATFGTTSMIIQFVSVRSILRRCFTLLYSFYLSSFFVIWVRYILTIIIWFIMVEVAVRISKKIVLYRVWWTLEKLDCRQKRVKTPDVPKDQSKKKKISQTQDVASFTCVCIAGRDPTSRARDVDQMSY